MVIAGVYEATLLNSEAIRMRLAGNSIYTYVNGGFLKFGVPLCIIHFNRIFHYKPSSYWRSPIYRNLQIRIRLWYFVVNVDRYYQGGSSDSLLNWSWSRVTTSRVCCEYNYIIYVAIDMWHWFDTLWNSYIYILICELRLCQMQNPTPFASLCGLKRSKQISSQPCVEFLVIQNPFKKELFHAVPMYIVMNS